MNIKMVNIPPGLTYFSYAALIAYLGVMSIGAKLQRTGKRINSQEELEKVVKEEANVIGLDDYLPLLVTYFKEGIAESTLSLLGKGDKRMIVRTITLGGKDATRKMAKHEVYHLKYHLRAPQKESFFEKAVYLAWDEPTAVIYALTGIELDAVGKFV